MSEFLHQTFYGNSILAWLASLAIILLSALAGKTIYWLLAKVVHGLTSRTSTRFDDLLVKTMQQPVVFFVTASGIWFGLKILSLPALADAAISNGYHLIYAVLVAWLLSRLLDAVYEEYLLPWIKRSDTDLDDQLAPILRKGVRLVIWTMAIVIGLDNAGYDAGALLAGLGIGGLALAMAAKDTVSNVFGGMTIFADQPFRLNDRIKISGYDGTVREIGVRSTRLRTLEGRSVRIPNSMFTDAPVENITSEPARKVVMNLGLTYDTTPQQMQSAIELLRVISAEEESTEETPTVAFSSFGDFALNILFVYYIKRGADIAGTQSAVNMEILSRFNAAGLEFAFPTQTLYTIGQQASNATHDGKDGG